MKPENKIRGLFAKVRADIDSAIIPCMDINNIAGGYFSVPIIIFSFIEYLGVLWKNPIEHDKKTKKALKYYSRSHFPDAAIPYMKKYLSNVRPEYKKYSGLLYSLYRHSLVHHFMPSSILLKNGEILSWGIAKGSVQNHLKIVESKFLISSKKVKNCKGLTINLEIFYQDLVKSINKFEFDALKHPTVRKRILRAEKKLNNSRPEDSLQYYVKKELKYI